MYYIWTDESDSTGKYYANFYGGILIRSEHYEEVLLRLSNHREGANKKTSQLACEVFCVTHL